MPDSADLKRRRYNRFLLLVSGLGGLLYGIDVGIIGGALPYLEATSRLTGSQLSVIVAAVLLGSVFSTLFAGLLTDWMGRKPLMILSGATFVASIPVIALSHGYAPLFFGRLLQGISGGLIGVVVPLYLAECLSAKDRGKGSGVFQWLLTLGIVSAAVIGIYFSYHIAEVARTESSTMLFLAKDQAWRRIFWMSMPPGVLFLFGALFVTESPRWLFAQNRRSQARSALLRSRSEEQAMIEFEEIERAASNIQTSRAWHHGRRDPLYQRRYIFPFLLACVILFCNTATGINSIIGYNTDILLQSGLSDLQAHWGYVVFTFVNFLMTIVGMTLVDRKGRKFLFLVGTSGIIVSLLFVSFLFVQSESHRFDANAALQREVASTQTLNFRFDQAEAARLLSASGRPLSDLSGKQLSLTVIYSYGGFAATTRTARSEEIGAAPIEVDRTACIPSSTVEAFFRNPFANLNAARTANLRIEHAYLGLVLHPLHGWFIAIGLYAFVAFYAMGPGVCVWLSLSELMPTRIGSVGMSIALVINQLVSTTLAAVFLPVVGKYGYSRMFLFFAGFTLIYFAVVKFLLPETKGKTLEEIQQCFE